MPELEPQKLDELEEGIEKTASESNDPKIKEEREKWALRLIRWKGLKLIIASFKDIVLTIGASITGIVVTINFVINKISAMKVKSSPVPMSFHHSAPDLAMAKPSGDLFYDIFQIIIILICFGYLSYQIFKKFKKKN